MENSTSAMDTKLSGDISAIRSGKAVFQKKTADKLEKQLKGVVTVIE
jgi:hypothetical protein